MDLLEVVLYNRNRETTFDGRSTVHVKIRESAALRELEQANWRDPEPGIDGIYFKLQEARRPLYVEVRVIPDDTSDFWAAQQEFTFHEKGIISTGTVIIYPEDDKYVDTNFVSTSDAGRLFFAYTSLTTEGHTIITISVAVTKVRNVFPKVQKILESLPENDPRREYILKPPDDAGVREPYPLTWDLPPREKLSVSKEWVVDTNDMKYDVNIGDANVTPRMLETVLQVRGKKVPQLFAVSVPRSFEPGGRNGDQLVAFHVHFRPYARQRSLILSNAQYPFDWGYIFVCLWRERLYLADAMNPVDNGRGYCYQITESRKAVALVLPCPGNVENFGRAEDPAWLEDILGEIQAHYFRLWGNRRHSLRPGRVSVSGFSAGNGAMARLLKKCTPEHVFREAYLLDAPEDELASNLGKILPMIEAWKKRFEHPLDRDGPWGFRVRVYAKFSKDSLNWRHWLTDDGKNPYNNSNCTYVILGPESWAKAVAERAPGLLDNDKKDWKKLHQLFASLMLTDALRRSGHPNE